MPDLRRVNIVELVRTVLTMDASIPDSEATDWVKRLLQSYNPDTSKDTLFNNFNDRPKHLKDKNFEDWKRAFNLNINQAAIDASTATAIPWRKMFGIERHFTKAKRVPIPVLLTRVNQMEVEGKLVINLCIQDHSTS